MHNYLPIKTSKGGVCFIRLCSLDQTLVWRRWLQCACWSCDGLRNADKSADMLIQVTRQQILPLMGFCNDWQKHQTDHFAATGWTQATLPPFILHTNYTGRRYADTTSLTRIAPLNWWLRGQIYLAGRRLLIKSVSFMWRGSSASGVLTTVMTKQLGAAGWFLDINYLASFQQRGTSCHTVVSQSLAMLSRKMSQRWQIWVEPLHDFFFPNCEAHWKTSVQPFTFLCCLIVFCFLTPPLLGALLSFHSLSAYCPVPPSAISPLLVVYSPQNTALSPSIFFWEPAACHLPVTSGAWLSTSL